MGSENGFAPNGRHTIIWTNDDLVYWRWLPNDVCVCVGGGGGGGSLIPAWISNQMFNKVWDEIKYLLPKFNEVYGTDR